jgi:hypothetical protein
MSVVALQKNGLPEGCFELVYNSRSVEETADTVPTTIGDSEWKRLLDINNDTNPFIKIEGIPIPCKGTGGVYEVPFWESFNKRIASLLLPGDKFGHEFISRQPTDFFTIGSKIAKDSNGQLTEYFKIYIPQEGFTTSNFGFIRDAKMGLVHYSIVTYPEYNMQKDDDDNEIRHFISTKGFERNDAVGYGEGAMSQVVNSAKIKGENIDFDSAKSLINEGRFKRNGSSDGEVIQNNFVMRPVLRAMLSHADVKNKSEIAELVSMIDRKRNGGRRNMDEEIETIKNGLDNGVININSIAEKLGIKEKLRNENDIKNASLVKELNSMLGSPADITATVKAMKAENAETAKVAVENAVIQAFGQPKVKNGKGEDVENKCYLRAMELCGNKSGEELQTAIENAKSDVFIKDELSERADNNSDFNTIVDNKDEKDTLEQNGAFVL